MSLFACIAFIFISFSPKKGEECGKCAKAWGKKKQKFKRAGEVGKEIKCLLLSADLLPNTYTIYQAKGGIDVHMYWVYCDCVVVCILKPSK